MAATDSDEEEEKDSDEEEEKDSDDNDIGLKYSLLYFAKY